MAAETLNQHPSSFMRLSDGLLPTRFTLSRRLSLIPSSKSSTAINHAAIPPAHANFVLNENNISPRASAIQPEHLTIYYGAGSPYSWAVLLMVEEMQLRHDAIQVNFATGETKTRKFLNMNPRGKVPILVEGDAVVNESNAIIHYLEFAHPECSFMPATAKQRAAVFTHVNETEHLGRVLCSPSVQKVIKARQNDQPLAQSDLQAAAQELISELTRWDNYLSRNTASFTHLVGNSFTSADAAFFPFVALLNRYGLELGDRYPRIQAYYHAMMQRESVKKTWPPHWLKSANRTWLNDLLCRHCRRQAMSLSEADISL